MNKLGNPFYKEYKKSPLSNKAYASFKLPEEVQNDFNNYIEMVYPNRNQAMIDLIINLLNSKSTERKYFNIDVVSIFPYIYEDEKSKICCFLSSKDNYLIERKGLDVNPSSINLNNETYLNPSKELSLEEFSTMLNNNHFTDSGIEPIELNYLKEAIQEYYLLNDYNFYDYTLVHFKINNFLDEIVDGEFKAANGNHKGIGYYKANSLDGFVFYTYEWKFNEDFSFDLVDISIISEDNFKSLILNSSNDELKRFLKDFKDLSSYPSAPSMEVNEIDELKEVNSMLKRRISELESFNMQLQEENKDLRDYNIELYQENKDSEKIDELRNLVKSIRDKNKG